MANRKCNRCGEEKPLDQFPRKSDCKLGRLPVCRSCKNADQRRMRVANGNEYTRRYEKTKRGFLMRAYRNMQSRIEGVQWRKAHLYAGKSLAVTREQFYEWAFTSGVFHALFDAWEASGHARTYTPSVDRIDSSKGYEFSNMQWVTHSENSRRGSRSKAVMGRYRDLFKKAE